MNYLQHVTIKGKMSAELSFKPGLNIISSPNGSGKTMLINAIRWALGGTTQRFRDSIKDELIYSVNLTFQNGMIIEREKNKPTLIKNGEKDINLDDFIFNLVGDREEYQNQNEILEILFQDDEDTVYNLWDKRYVELFFEKNKWNPQPRPLSLPEQIKESLNKERQKIIRESIDSLINSNKKDEIITFLFKKAIFEEHKYSSNCDIIRFLESKIEEIKKINTKINMPWHSFYDFSEFLRFFNEYFPEGMRDSINKENIVQRLRHQSRGEISFINNLLNGIILSTLKIPFPIFIDGFFASLSTQHSYRILDLYFTLTQVIILTSRELSNQEIKNLELSGGSYSKYNSIFYRSSFDLVKTIEEVISGLNLKSTNEADFIHSAVKYRPDFLIEYQGKRIAIEVSLEKIKEEMIRYKGIIDGIKTLDKIILIVEKEIIIFDRDYESFREVGYSSGNELKLNLKRIIGGLVDG